MTEKAWEFPPGRYDFWLRGTEHSEEFVITNTIRKVDGSILYLETVSGQYINFENVLTFSKVGPYG